ncbi:uncharacterized protein [Misgurnus anguillicaudatus]|uniref:uncharacterized protein n=1 Tax=Misgurnus anguillicaudatus TaxID=75329 RepID=UPI003CCF783F
MFKKPKQQGSSATITVKRAGPIRHLKTETRFRPASNIRRGRIARVVSQGVSHVFYKRLRSTPVKELISGNLTQSLNKNILKVISTEIKKSMLIHENVFIEMHLTQRILKECDSSFYNIPGYIQLLQINPFGAHLYTEVGVSILVHHLRKKETPVSLYLDATGGVVSKLPEQKKRVLYYALTLPGKGRDAPPLPVCELLSNEHSIPPLTFWLMQFLLKLSNYTSIRINKVETDYSWALMQAVVLAFNRMSMDSYLEWTNAVCRKSKTSAEIKAVTILHLCSAHIIKAVIVSIGRKTNDKGLKEFSTFVFARLQNTLHVESAIEIFEHFCVVLLSETVTQTVTNSLQFLESLINNERQVIEDITGVDVIDTWEDEAERRSAKTIVGRSPYSRMFRRVFDEVENTVDKAQDAEVKNKNLYYCPEIPKVLMDNYMGIFPLWSGVMLGNLKRFASDKENTGNATQTVKTRDTNCHVEKWFGIVKNSILHKKRKFRPAEFIQKMYASLKGRYTEHIINHSFPENLLVRPIRPMKHTVELAEESWSRREMPTPQNASRSKYYSTPKKDPKPTTKVTKKKGDKTTVKQPDSQTTRQSDNKTPRQSDNNTPRQPDNQTTRQQDSQTTRQSDNKTTTPQDGQTTRQTDNKTTTPQDGHTTRQPEDQTTRQTDNETDRQSDNETDRQSDNETTTQQDGLTTRQTDNQTDTQPARKFCKMDVSEQVKFLWTSPDTELVVAVFQSGYTLRHADLATLRPHELLNGETIECYFWTVLQKHNKANHLYLLNHYVNQLILRGTQQEVERQGLRNVNFNSYDGIISFINVNRNHWKFVYLHALSGQIFVVDPMSDGLRDSRRAARRYQEYFKMRLNTLGRDEWTKIEWKPGQIKHTFQMDATSCGVFVMEMANETVAQFPQIPKIFEINSSRSSISNLRNEMAECLLSYSDAKENYCAFCGLEDLPGKSRKVMEWTQCECCEHWFHDACLGSTVPDKSLPWFCVLCIDRISP